MKMCVGMRGGAGQVKQCLSCRCENFERFEHCFHGVTTCHDELFKCTCVASGVTYA